METIAEINDLACRSIEIGDYHIALDVLNSCLGCVKQLKKVRARIVSESTSTAEVRRHKATKECIVRTLRAAKRKLLDRSSVILKTNFVEGNKRKGLSSFNRSRKRRRPTQRDDVYPRALSISSNEVSLASSNSIPLSHRYPFSASATTISQESMTAPFFDSCSCNSSSHNSHISCHHHNKEQRRFSFQDTEELYFVYQKPIRLSKFQWTRINECHCKEDLEGGSNHQDEIRREVELAVSANLIFNIALSHHLIASSKRSEQGRHHRRRSLGLSPDSGEDTDDDDEEENGCGYDIVADALETKQRLKGALRLYELGFRVHTKRVAFVMSSKGQSSRRGYLYSSTSSIPSVSNSLPSVSPSLSSTESQLRQVAPSPNNLRSLRRERNGDHDEELKSTTRFALALLNNCAHIHKSLGQSEKAKVFQKRLLSFLLVIVDSGESVHDIIGDDPAVDGYLKNVFAGTVFDQKTAPAAMA